MLDRTSDGGTVIIHLQCKSLDVSNVSDFKKRLPELIVGADRIVLDMGSVEFLDSSGLGGLVSLLRISAQQSLSLCLCSVKRPVQVLLEMVRMHKLFEIYATTQDALNHEPR